MTLPRKANSKQSSIAVVRATCDWPVRLGSLSLAAAIPLQISIIMANPIEMTGDSDTRIYIALFNLPTRLNEAPSFPADAFSACTTAPSTGEAIFSGVKMETEVFVSLYRIMAGKGLLPLIR